MRIRIQRPVNKSSNPINTTLVAKQQKKQPVNHPKLDSPDPKFNFDLSKIPISSPNRPSSPVPAKLSTTIQCFTEPEHTKIGDVASIDTKGKATEIKLPNNLTVTFGEMQAMADHFRSPQRIWELAKVAGNDGQKPGSIDEVKYVLYVMIRDDKERESEFSEQVKDNAKGRSYAQAASNIPHFTNPKEGNEKLTVEQKAKQRESKWNPETKKFEQVPINNAGSYRENHELAIKEAVEAGKTGMANDRAMLYEAFATHFLADAYASGHIRTPRASILDYWNQKVPMFWTNIQWWMAENIAQHLNNQSGFSQLATVQILWEQARTTIKKAVEGMPKLGFGDVIAGAVHDYDNKYGVQTNVAGKVVRLIGEGQIIEQQDLLRFKDVVADITNTMELAKVAVQASLKDIHYAYTQAKSGKTAEQVKESLKLKQGIFRAEQLFPKTLPDTDVRQQSKSLNWQVDTVGQLLADSRMLEAITIFANAKADTLKAEIKLEEPLRGEKELAFQEGVVNKLKTESPAKIKQIFLEILNYTSGSIAPLGGVGGHDVDDNAVEYYKKAKEQNALGTLTFTQKYNLIWSVLEGTTLNEEESMIVDILNANTSDAPKLIETLGWRRFWHNIHGDECREFVQKLGSIYWQTQSYGRKRDEVEFLANGRTNDLAQETIIIILRTCTGEEIRKIDKEVGGWTGLSFDLTGKWQTEFEQLKAQ